MVKYPLILNDVHDVVALCSCSCCCLVCVVFLLLLLLILAVLKESVLSLYVDFESEYFICSCIFSVISGEEEGRVKEREREREREQRMRSEKFKRRKEEKNEEKK